PATAARLGDADETRLRAGRARMSRLRRHATHRGRAARRRCDPRHPPAPRPSHDRAGPTESWPARWAGRRADLGRLIAAALRHPPHTLKGRSTATRPRPAATRPRHIVLRRCLQDSTGANAAGCPSRRPPTANWRCVLSGARLGNATLFYLCGAWYRLVAYV